MTIAGKGGVGKTTIAALLARNAAAGGDSTLAVDCDPNPNLGESFGLASTALDRFGFADLRRAGETLAFVREPRLVLVEQGLWVLGGPPGPNALHDAVARGIAGVLLAKRFRTVVTDLGGGPELARIAVGGVLNPADVCVVLTDGTRTADLTAGRIEEACTARGVHSLRVLNRRGQSELVAAELAAQLEAS